MKCSELWLREWVNPDISQKKLAQILTMAGLEVEELIPASGQFEGVVIGLIQAVHQHPEAEQLSVCEVNVGSSDILTIVCGAPNVKVGIKIPVAMIQSILPHKLQIVATTIRHIISQGMLCSAYELGLSQDKEEGLFILPKDAPLGCDLRVYLGLEDVIYDLSITPNRGDCLSVRGLAREIAALTDVALLKTQADIKAIASLPDTLPVELVDEQSCAHYTARIIRNVKVDAPTPIWIKERLRRSGIRSISVVVDVTNYVMLELGQPMHAFDLDQVKYEIKVRRSEIGEKIVLLDGSEQTLDDQTLVIADRDQPLAIAGVMGGLTSSVTLQTKDILLESAFFSPEMVARQRQHYSLNSESAYRFERGVDPTIQVEALERATQLILEFARGEVGPVIEVTSRYTKAPTVILLDVDKIEKTLGFAIPKSEIESIFTRLGFDWQCTNNSWLVKVPLYRADIMLAEDLIEEIARLFGYDRIPTRQMTGPLLLNHAIENSRDWHVLRQLMVDQGFHEIVSYSFISEKLQSLLDPSQKGLVLHNPISSEMAMMRTNLWPGLVSTLLYNVSRKQQRVRLFEIGTCFSLTDEVPQESLRLGGLISGYLNPEQWGLPSREVDFFDLKGNIENILHLYYPLQTISFQVDHHPALHPGQTAGIYCLQQKIGVLGALHPQLLQAFAYEKNIFVFELDLCFFKDKSHFVVQEVSKFPEIRRDIAILVDEAIPVKDIQDTIIKAAGTSLKNMFIFDLYQGKGIAEQQKSIALALIFQHPTRTLVDEEASLSVECIITALKEQFGAQLRS